MDLEAFLSMMSDFLPQGVYDPNSLTDTAKRLMLAPWSSETGKRALFRNFRRLNPEYTQAIAEALPLVEHDTLILWGREDPFQKPVYAERLQETLPHAQLAWLDEAAHWLMEEKPEEVTGLLQRFLARPDTR
ncbi:MAG: alpha/beta hydrolase [Gammaproteobacteria bacterium]|nr:alpha/beta hydrolase [Gammaproteobacteria bacterium]